MSKIPIQNQPQTPAQRPRRTQLHLAPVKVKPLPRQSQRTLQQTLRQQNKALQLRKANRSLQQLQQQSSKSQTLARLQSQASQFLLAVVKRLSRTLHQTHSVCSSFATPTRRELRMEPRVQFGIQRYPTLHKLTPNSLLLPMIRNNFSILRLSKASMS